jgi:hypothetical protein
MHEEVVFVKELTPKEWGKKKDLVYASKYVGTLGMEVTETVYATADYLHGWSKNEYHFADTPFLLSEDDFDYAIIAASNFPTVEPHEAALTPYARSLRAKKVK